MESSFLDILQLPWPQNPSACYIYMDQLLPVSWVDTNILISQIASETERLESNRI